jgi:hypothetical protein
MAQFSEEQPGGCNGQLTISTFLVRRYSIAMKLSRQAGAARIPTRAPGATCAEGELIISIISNRTRT